MIVLRAGLCWLLAQPACVALATMAAAQGAADPPISSDEFREISRASQLGNAFQALTVFGGTPDISGGRFSVDPDDPGDLSISAIRLPLGHRFAPVAPGVRPYIEGTFGYVRAEDTVITELDPVGPTTVESDIDTLSLVAGAGIELELLETTFLTPILLAGYSHINDQVQISGALADELISAGNGSFFNVDLNSVILGGALELSDRRELADDIGFEGEIRYNFLYTDIFKASDDVLETSDTFSVLTARVEFDGPTPLRLLNRDLRWVALVGNTYLPGNLSDALGFTYFFNVGGGIKIREDLLWDKASAASVTAAGIIGDNVTGWTVGVRLYF